MEGCFELARQLLATSNAVYADLGLTLNAATSQNEAVIELLAGNPAAAEESLRKDIAHSRDGRAHVSVDNRCVLARAVLEQGRDEEAEDLAKLSATGREGRLALADPLARRTCSGVRQAWAV